MPVLTPEPIAEPAPLVAPVFRAVGRGVRIPAWAVFAVILTAGLSGYAAGHRRPAHHYVPYFGNMVVDTTTGKACYAVTPRPSDAGAGEQAAPIDGTVTRTDMQPTTGPSIPVCGQE